MNKFFKIFFVITVIPVVVSWAGPRGQEYQFKGTDGQYLLSGLVSDGTGNFYGTAEIGGLNSCGVVFKWSNQNGILAKTTVYNFASQNDGCYPLGKLTLDSAGNLYGTTLRGGTMLYGTVFELFPGPGGTWTEKVLYSFPPPPAGFYPGSGVILDSTGNLYGTTLYGGIGGNGFWGGTAFKLSPSQGGWTETTIYEFPQFDSQVQTLPNTSLVFDSSGNLYGVTSQGGTTNWGTAFELTPNQDGTWTENVLHNFTDGLDGGNPTGGLTFDSAGNLYGEASQGGSFACPVYGCGVIFKLTPGAGGWNFSVVYTLNGLDGIKGEGPTGGLSIDNAGNIYGTTTGGGTVTCFGSFQCGTIFELTSTSFKVLASFDGIHGAEPYAGVILDATGNLYGTTYQGGDLKCDPPYGCGVVFELTH